jgi:protease-4
MRLVLGACTFLGLVGTTAYAQSTTRFAEEPTDGLALPTAPIAGEYDGRVVAMNPGGLPLVRGAEFALAMELEDLDVASSSGAGFGGYFAGSLGGGLFPRLGMGFGVEWLRGPRELLAPDPGEPVRTTLGLALPLGKNGGLGWSWHHFFDDGMLAGVDTHDFGLAYRIGNHFSFGAVAKDVFTTEVAGTPVQRRYELELTGRPLGTDRLDLALGGRVGETRGDLDGWGRVTARVARGVYLHASVESRSLQTLTTTVDGTVDDERRDTRATFGVELSFGGKGVIALATGLRDNQGDYRALGGQLVLRASALGSPSVVAPSEHLERIELSGSISLRELTSHITRLRAIARDESVAGVVVAFDGVDAGWGTLQELRDELMAIRKAGKQVYAYMVTGTGRDYFVASAAHKIYIDPAGGLRLVGMAGTTMYFRGFFDTIGVTPQFEKIAEYKSAPEQFTETHPTETAAKMNNELFDSLWDQWLSQVSASRGLSKEELQKLIDEGPYSAGDLAVAGSLASKLVDGVGAPDKISQLVATDMGRVLAVDTPRRTRPDRWERPGIAVIYVEGDITDGKSQTVPLLGRKVAGGETLVQTIAAARANPDIGAIILRIDSPGGSALASELVSREVFATRGVKPILCSMSDVAASGGYFIAAGCDLIFAEPTTITGSIGIFYGKFDLSGLIGKLGITTDTYKRGKRSDVESYFRPFTDDERVSLMKQLEYMYGRFVGAVAEGRKMEKTEVDTVGRGHVWTGDMAKPIKLVDRFGGLGDAIDEAKTRMGLPLTERVQLVELPEVSGGLLALVGKFLGGAQAQATPSLLDLPVVRSLLSSLPASVLTGEAVPQARMPFDLEWW